jgi:hypothetical protein
MTAEESRLIGELMGKVDTLLEGQRDIFSRINDMQANGCSIGREQTRRIEKLEERPEKALSVMGAVIGVCSAMATAFMWIWNHGK